MLILLLPFFLFFIFHLQLIHPAHHSITEQFAEDTGCKRKVPSYHSDSFSHSSLGWMYHELQRKCQPYEYLFEHFTKWKGMKEDFDMPETNNNNNYYYYSIIEDTKQQLPSYKQHQSPEKFYTYFTDIFLPTVEKCALLGSFAYDQKMRQQFFLKKMNRNCYINCRDYTIFHKLITELWTTHKQSYIDTNFKHSESKSDDLLNNFVSLFSVEDARNPGTLDLFKQHNRILISTWHKVCDQQVKELCANISDQDLVFILEDSDYLGCSKTLIRTLATLIYNRRKLYQNIRTRVKFGHNLEKVKNLKPLLLTNNINYVYEQLIQPHLYSCATLWEDNPDCRKCILKWADNHSQNLRIDLDNCYLHSLHDLNILIQHFFAQDEFSLMPYLLIQKPRLKKPSSWLGPKEEIGNLEIHLSKNFFDSLHSKKNKAILPQTYKIYIKKCPNLTTITQSTIDWVKNKYFIADREYRPDCHLNLYNSPLTDIDMSSLTMFDRIYFSYNTKNQLEKITSYQQFLFKREIQVSLISLLPFIVGSLCSYYIYTYNMDKYSALIEQCKEGIITNLNNIKIEHGLEKVSKVWIDLQKGVYPFTPSPIRDDIYHNNLLQSASHILLDSDTWFEIAQGLIKNSADMLSQVSSFSAFNAFSYLTFGISAMLSAFIYGYMRAKYIFLM